MKHSPKSPKITAKAITNASINNEFFMVYQPIYHLGSKKVVSMEALMRWTHPHLGDISPDIFIPIAEKSGLIHLIGMWALKTACLHAKEWQLQGHPDVTLAVNLSPVHLLKEDLPRIILDILDETRFPPDRLEVEITETSLMPNLPLSVSMINQLHDIGLRVTIDDFGTGYFSLMYLSQLALHALKIDKAFIQNINKKSNDTFIITSLILLAEKLKLDIIAEGIESKEHLEFLLKHHCPLGQGFYLSPPLKSEDVLSFLKKKSLF